MELSHYSVKGKLAPASTKQLPAYDSFAAKPEGLWLSVDGDDDWLSWCVSEGFNLSALTYRFRLVLRDGANILHLDTNEKLRSFTETYGESQPDYKNIDWRAVAGEHQGIIIAPYQWESRLKLMWYYGWDCASGCIWDADAIGKIFEPTRVTKVANAHQD